MSNQSSSLKGRKSSEKIMEARRVAKQTALLSHCLFIHSVTSMYAAGMSTIDPDEWDYKNRIAHGGDAAFLEVIRYNYH